MVKLQQMVGRAKQSRHFVAVALFVFGTTASILGQLTFPQAASAVATSPENKPVVEKICGSESTPSSDEEITLWNSCAQKVISQYTTCNTGGADGAKIAQCLKSGLGDTAKNVSAQDLKTAVDAGKAAATAEPKTEEECKAKGDTWEWDAETRKCSEKGAEAGKAECAVPGGIGWAICPIMTILSGMNDTLYAAIASFLIIEPQLFDTSDKSPYPAWQQFQSIANVIFIIGFIVVVYSQITGAGLSNYGVKKMLPKLIVIAILVNISYFLCQLAVDVSNLLGVSLKSVFDAIAGQNVTEVNVAAGGWTKIIAIVLAAAGAGLLLLAVSTPVLLAAFLALAMIALILIVRKALIVLLIVVSPVAFALYLLPNTEQWTKKWGKLFFSLLMLYPIIGVVFGASALASSVLLQLDGDMNKIDMNKIVALGASALPLFVVPGLLKGSLAATGKLGAKMQGWGDKATGAASGGMRKKAGERYENSTLGRFNKYRQGESAKRKSLIQAGVYKGKGGSFNPRNLRSKASNRFNESVLSGSFGSKTAASGVAATSKLDQEEVDNEIARMNKGFKGPGTELQEAKDAYRTALLSGDVVRARAAQKILLSKGSAGVSAIRDVVAVKKDAAGRVIYSGLSGVSNAAVDYARSELAAAGIKGKDAALNQWSYDSSGRSLEDIDADAKTFSGLTDTELAGQSAEVLGSAVAAGHIDRARRDALLSNQTIEALLSEDKKAVLR